MATEDDAPFEMSLQDEKEASECFFQATGCFLWAVDWWHISSASFGVAAFGEQGSSHEPADG